MRNRAIRILVVIVLALPQFVNASGKRPMTLDDLDRLQNVGSPQLSPDGRFVIFSLSSTKYRQNRSTSSLMIGEISSGKIRKLCKGSSPQWSPDGKQIALFAQRGNRTGLWIRKIPSGEERFLTEVPQTDHFLGHNTRKNFAWSADSKKIAYVAAEGPRKSSADSSIKVIDRILYKTRTGFSDNRKTHIWVVDVNSGKKKVLTPGKYDEHSLSWSPDSKRIVFISNHSKNPDNNYLDDLWTVELASGNIARLTNTIGTEFQPTWSPDGRSIAFLATVRLRNTKDSPPENTKLYVISSDGLKRRRIASNVDRRIRSIEWHPTGKSIYFTIGDHGYGRICNVDLPTESVKIVAGQKAMSRSYSVSNSGNRLAYTQSDATHPGELFIADAMGNNAKRFTSYNDEFREQIRLQNAEMFWFKSYDGTRVQGWLVKPVGFDDSKKWPLIQSIHGGPHGMYGESFSARNQLLAANGYAVLFVNPRGSTGYGQTFADGCVLNWGGGDYKDLMAGLDDVLASNSWIDKNRLGVTGGSYGGFMTNWVITQTNRFKAAVSVASVSNLISFYGTSLYQLLIETEFDGLPFDNYAMLWQWSPIRLVKNVTTPTMFLHGEADHDVPITQAEEMFIGLKKRGVDSQLVRYAGEGHGFRQPKHRLDYYRRTIAWFDKYLKPQNR